MLVKKQFVKRCSFCLLIFFLLSSGCTPLGKGGRQGPSSHSRPGVQLFEPYEKSGVLTLSQEEARHLAVSLSPRQQGFGKSWTEYAFPLSQSLKYAETRPQGNRAIDRPGLTVTYGTLAATLHKLQSLLPELDGNPELLADKFTWYRLGPDFGITGYYEPTLEASRTKSAKYNYPLYRLPKDVRSGKPYHTRNAIDRQGALHGKGLEIAWVTSEAEAFFLHIQGSGRLRFPDGSVTHVLYAGKNNRAYKALGKIMKEEGLLQEGDINMKSIHRVLDENPHRQAELFDRNPSYIFFREADKGPLGAMGRPLTPWVSVATDRSVLPHGSAVFLISPIADSEGNMTRPFYGLTLPQDTGGAIKGNRIDLFGGPGKEAEHMAGYQNSRGAVYVLVLKK